jgi:hypothetical protein
MDSAGRSVVFYRGLNLVAAKRPFDLGLTVHDLSEDRHIGKEVLKHHAVADAGGVSLVVNLV